ncbi:hypothetical protein HU200_002892 [Digitaria exilis]|uniref:Uncharacterized protein n=1 Tax=Digitaria exilis TaxID=1010633 RepID=A0A835KV48_9POAL|nr:hypothetical protein HU200_002892 [Digitaria exilis]
MHLQEEAPQHHQGNQEVCTKSMSTTDVRIDAKLNKYIWSSSIRSVPRRVWIASKRTDECPECQERQGALLSGQPLRPPGGSPGHGYQAS